jgi:hypothetical protein
MLSVWSCSFRKLHSHHHEIFYRQEQASLPLIRPKKTPLHDKKRASPSVGGVASQTKLPKATGDNPRENPPATNGQFCVIAALPSFEIICYFCTLVARREVCVSRYHAKLQKRYALWRNMRSVGKSELPEGQFLVSFP